MTENADSAHDLHRETDHAFGDCPACRAAQRPRRRDWDAIAIGYTLGTGRLFCSMEEMQTTVEELLGRPVLTHEFGDKDTWTEIRTALEARALDVMADV